MASERVVLNKSQLSTEAGAGLVRLYLQVGLDGDLSNDDIQVISNYVNPCDDSVPAVRHLKAILADALADGVIANTERARPPTSVKETKSNHGLFILAVIITTALLLFFASRSQ